MDEIVRRYKYLGEYSQIKDSPNLFNGEKMLIPRKEIDPFTCGDGTTLTFELVNSNHFTDPGCIRLFNVLLNRTMGLFPMKNTKNNAIMADFDGVVIRRRGTSVRGKPVVKVSSLKLQDTEKSTDNFSANKKRMSVER